MTSDIKSVVKELDRKELIEIANQNRINIPNNWSKRARSKVHKNILVYRRIYPKITINRE